MGNSYKTYSLISSCSKQFCHHRYYFSSEFIVQCFKTEVSAVGCQLDFCIEFHDIKKFYNLFSISTDN